MKNIIKALVFTLGIVLFFACEPEEIEKPNLQKVPVFRFYGSDVYSDLSEVAIDENFGNTDHQYKKIDFYKSKPLVITEGNEVGYNHWLENAVSVDAAGNDSTFVTNDLGEVIDTVVTYGYTNLTAVSKLEEMPFTPDTIFNPITIDINTEELAALYGQEIGTQYATVDTMAFECKTERMYSFKVEATNEGIEKDALDSVFIGIYKITEVPSLSEGSVVFTPETVRMDTLKFGGNLKVLEVWN